MIAANAIQKTEDTHRNKMGRCMYHTKNRKFSAATHKAQTRAANNTQKTKNYHQPRITHNNVAKSPSQKQKTFSKHT
jgi:lipopolysaccharide assembly outer membrane protein LptD (OstA)